MGKQKGGKWNWNPFKGKTYEKINGKKEIEYGPWYDPYIKVLNIKKTYKNAAIKAAKTSAKPTLKAMKKKVWTKKNQTALKAAGKAAAETMRKKIWTNATKKTLVATAKRGIKTGLTKSAKSFVHNPKVKEKNAQIIASFIMNKVIGAIMPSP